MRTNCGPWRLPQENESSPVAFHPIPVPRQSKFRDRNSEVQRYGPDYPMQSYLKNCSPVITNSYSLLSHEHCITSAYGSQANPTSTHAGSSQYVSPWRSVARWETNGTDPLPPVVREKKDYGRDRAAIALCRQFGCLDERAVRNMGLGHLLDEEPEGSPTTDARGTEMENGQIALPQPCPETNAESFPPSNAALFLPNDSPSNDISVNPQWSPLSSSSPTRLSHY